MTEAQILQIFAITYFSVGFGMVINSSFYYKMFKELQSPSPILYISGISALVIGWILITFYGCWSNDWSAIITVFGWLAFVKGILILIFPKQMSNLVKFIIAKESCVTKLGVLITVGGLLLGYVGFSGLV